MTSVKYVRSIVYVVAAVAAIVVFVRPVSTQARPEIQHVAAQTANKVAKTQPRSALLTPLTGCFEARDLCAEFDSALRAALEKDLPGLQFIEREKALPHLTDHGFLSIDAYAGALDLVASEAGADVVIGEEFRRKRSSCELHATITDTKHLYELGGTDSGISCAAVPTESRLSLLTDTETGVSLIIPVPRPADAPAGPSSIRYPSCMPGGCPEPHYTGFARQQRLEGTVGMLITVNEQGTVDDARVLGAVDEGLARASVETVRGWHLRAAIGPEGKPFRARVPVEVDFKLLPR
jgi:TonB family protein